MGQCLFCTRTDTASIDAMEEKESLTYPTHTSDKPHDPSPRQSGMDSAPDSGHSSGDDASCCVAVGDGTGGVVPPAVEPQGRNSHSSESSGKYSMRGSIGSCGDCDRSHLFPARIDECSIDMPVFEEKGQLGDDEDGGVFTHDSLHPLQDVTRPRKVSRGSSRGSRGSSSSERGSFSSVTSVTAILKARLGRSSSLSVQRDMPEAEVLSTSSYVASDSERPHRTVSLRLPRSHRRPHDSDTNLPTIYVDDSPQQQSGRRRERKSSLQRALSLLSMNSLLRHQSTSSSSSSSSSKKAQKPVQKILRQPRRRHDTVRGLSGLAIDKTNQGISYSGLQRAHTLYYPTATSLRYASTARRTKSTTT